MAGFWDFVPTLINVVGTGYGAKLASDATKDASRTLTESQGKATQAELAAIEAAKQVFQQQQKDASPGLIATQEIIGRGERLTPLQARQLEDGRRRTLDALQGGNLRGSARATVAAVNDVEGRMYDQFMDSNRSRADSAASGLTGQYFNAGRNMGELDLKTGQSLSSGLTSTGEINASSQLGIANTKGQAIGDIAAVIAEQFKNDSRPSSYSRNQTDMRV